MDSEKKHTELTAEDVGMIELILLQLAHDFWTRLANCKKIRESSDSHVERLLVGDAFNESFKILKRHVVAYSSEDEYAKIMEDMADYADSLDNASNHLYSTFYTECVTNIVLEDCESMALNLTVTTLLRMSNHICAMALKKNNKRTMNIIRRFDEFSDKHKLKALNEKFRFNQTNITESETYLMDCIVRIIKKEK